MFFIYFLYLLKARYIVEFEDEDFGTQTFEITLSE